MHVAAGDADESGFYAIAGHLYHTGVGACGLSDGLDLIRNLLGLGDGGERLVDALGHVRA